MARITVNTTGTQPVLLITTDTANANIANGQMGANILSVTCLQDITITNSTGVYSWTDFCGLDMNKLTTPADNEISVNVVIDDTVWFGNSSYSPNTAAPYLGVSDISQNKEDIVFKLVMNNSNTAGNVANTFYYMGQGFISSLAPTVNPEAPVWVSPLSIAVNGTMYSGKNP